MATSIDVVQVGLGPIGLGCVQSLNGREGVRLKAVVDSAPSIIGRRLGDLSEGTANDDLVVRSSPPPIEDGHVGVALITTTSSLKLFCQHSLPYLEAGYHIVSSCEELSFPWRIDREIAEQIDAAARKYSVSVVGTGVNPGFLMDHWPLTATGLSRSIESITVERFQNAFHRRRPFQEKIGAGLTVDEFGVRVDKGDIRHVGLTESMHFLAEGLGWELDRTEDIVECVVAEDSQSSPHINVDAGEVAGVYQHGHGYIGDREVITMIFRASIGEPVEIDRVSIKGNPPATIEIVGGVQGDSATCNVLVNTAAVVSQSTPGLRTMAEIPTPACCR